MQKNLFLLVVFVVFTIVITFIFTSCEESSSGGGLFRRKDSKGPQSKSELLKIISERIKENNAANLNDIDTSAITDMSYLFVSHPTFKGDISHWNVSKVTNMRGMFEGVSDFNGNISKWDVQNVTNMSDMFKGATVFNGNISKWDVQNVTNMSNMFNDAISFNQNISNWNVSKVSELEKMFYNAANFNQKLDKWDIRTSVGKAIQGKGVFTGSAITEKPVWLTLDIVLEGNTIFMLVGEKANKQIIKYPRTATGKFEIVSTTTLPSELSFDKNTGVISSNRPLTENVKKSYLIKVKFTGDGEFSGKISFLDVKVVIRDVDTPITKYQLQKLLITIRGLNADLNIIDVSKITDMSGLFDHNDLRSFNGDISGWDVSKVTNMSAMFRNNSAFDGDISKWDVSKVTNMSEMFKSSSFDGDISGWNVNKVTNMSAMFRSSSFNGDISGWDVSKVTNMSEMFRYSAFNGDISKWDVSKVTNMSGMFKEAPFFDRDISGWDVSKVTNMSEMFRGAKVFDKDLELWGEHIVGREVDITNMFISSISSSIIVTPSNVPSWSYVFKNINILSLFKGQTVETYVRKIFPIQEMGTYSIEPNTISTDTGGINFDAINGSIKGKARKELPKKEYTIIFTSNELFGRKVIRIPFTIEIKATDSKYSYFPLTKAELIESIKHVVDKDNNNTIDDKAADLNIIYTGTITDMSSVFNISILRSFNGDISGWDVSNVTNMNAMFSFSSFNGDISDWDVSNVTNMSTMFSSSSFNGDISDWDVSNVTNMSTMFSSSSFNGDISDWDVNNVTNMSNMFKDNKVFNGDISKWKTGKLTNTSGMFNGGYNANATVRRNRATIFNQDLSAWDVSKVTDMNRMFYNNKKFNQDLSAWDVSKVTDMGWMFTFTESFNNDLSGWDTGNVTNMDSMFEGSSFAGYGNDKSYISGWDVSKVTNMAEMFYQASNFNGDISYWDVSKVTTMFGMFKDAKAFNQDLSTWKVSSVTNIGQMFYGATVFDKDLENWKPYLEERNINKSNTFPDTVSPFNIPTWYNYVFRYNSTDNELTTDETDNNVSIEATFSPQEAIGGYTIKPLLPAGLKIDLTNGTISGTPTAGSVKTEYTVTFKGSGDYKGKNISARLSIKVIDTTNIKHFVETKSDLIKAIKDVMDTNNDNNPDNNTANLNVIYTGKIIDMSGLFDDDDLRSFNGDISNWDVSKVTNMSSMFEGANAFNGDISNWDVSKVTNMSSMFEGAIAFNGDISGWDVSKVTNMSSMFEGAIAFNRDITNWSVAEVTSMYRMFKGASSFNQDLEVWGKYLSGRNVRTIKMFANADGSGTGLIFTKDAIKKVPTWLYDFVITFDGEIEEEPSAFYTIKSEKTVNITITKNYPPFLEGSFSIEPNTLKEDTGLDFAKDTGIISGNTVDKDVDVKKYTIIFTEKAGNKTNEIPFSITVKKSLFIPKNRAELIAAIKQIMDVDKDGNMDKYDADLNVINTGKVTDMNSLFNISVFRSFNGDISGWDVSNVTNMSNMFKDNKVFNGDISKWKTGKVTNMRGMFDGGYNSNATTRRNRATIFNQDISGWDVSNVTNMSYMFYNNKKFNQDLSAWDVSKVTDMNRMFIFTESFNNDLSGWDTGNVTNMDSMFEGSSFVGYGDKDGDGNDESYISDWDVSKVTNMKEMFYQANNFNGDISDWDVSSVTNMFRMFKDAKAFNQDISKWVVVSVTTIAEMFKEASAFEQKLDMWGKHLATTVTKTNMFEEASKIVNDKVPLWLYTLTLAKKNDDGTYTTSNSFSLTQGSTAEIKLTREIQQSLKADITGVYSIFPDITDIGLTLATDIGLITGTPNKTVVNNQYVISFIGNGDYADKQIKTNFNLRVNIKDEKYTHFPLTKAKLIESIKNVMGSDNNADLNVIYTGNITDMSSLFYTSELRSFNGDISSWDVSKVTNMSSMFRGSSFNGNISSWDVSKVTNMSSMFYNNQAFNNDLSDWETGNVTNMDSMFEGSSFVGYGDKDGDGNDESYISGWDVSKVTNMAEMFKDTEEFNGDISKWKTGKVTSMNGMFYNNQAFNQDISSWDVSKVTNMSNMFALTESFNNDLSGWETGNVTNMDSMFEGSIFVGYGDKDGDGDDESYISGWDVSKVTNMAEMFKDTEKFNGDISKWKTGELTSMNGMFYSNQAFNQDISDWDVSKVTNMSSMFYSNQAFNNDLSGWDTGNVTNMDSMFESSSFVGYGDDDDESYISGWDVSKVTNMTEMFRDTEEFNGDISEWKTEKVTNMSGMFMFAESFNQDLSGWETGNVTNMTEMFKGSGFVGYGDDDDESYISGWDVSEVTNMSSMFEDAEVFNGDISGWDVSKVTNMNSMFEDATLFDKNLDVWKDKLLSSVSTTDMFSGVPEKVIPIWLYDFDITLNNNTVSGNIFVLRKNQGAITIAVRKTFPSGATGTYSILPNTLTVDTGLDFAEDTGTISGIPSKVLSEKEYTIRFTGDGDFIREPLDMPLTLRILDGNYSYFPITKAELISAIKKVKDTNGKTGDNPDTVDLNVIYTGNITDMSSLFYTAELRSFNGDISGWDVSQVTNMSSMFRDSSFNGNILGWDVSKVMNMSSMFQNNKVFNRDISDWETGNVTNMDSMFEGSSFVGYGDKDGDGNDESYISGWDVSKVTDMTEMFKDTEVFNGDISEWKTGELTSMNRMFYNNKAFNQDISGWNVSKVTDMRSMFALTKAFNNDLSGWDTGNVTNMDSMFEGSSFVGYGKDGDGNDKSYISGWDVSKVTDMTEMFKDTEVFNGDISEWKTRELTSMNGMFYNNQAFNQDISGWDVSKVTDMRSMFALTKAFNNDLSGWDTGNVTNMDSMFEGSSFVGYGKDGDGNDESYISGWDVSKVTNMIEMFKDTKVFNGDISGWDVSQVTNMSSMFKDATVFDKNLDVWGTRIKSSVTTTDMFSGVPEKVIPIWLYNFSFTFNTVSGNTFVLRKDQSAINISVRKTFPSGATGTYSILPDTFTADTGLNFAKETGLISGTATKSLSEKTYTIRFTGNGDFSGKKLDLSLNLVIISKYYPSNKTELITNIKEIMDTDGDDVPDNNAADLNSISTSAITDMSSLFYTNDLKSFNGDISSWDVSRVTNMNRMFRDSSFNGDISDWNVSKVMDMAEMFRDTKVFNGDISKWDVSKVTNMLGMFRNSSFNGDISGWDVSKVTNMRSMFEDATVFDKNLQAWGTRIKSSVTTTDMFKNLKKTVLPGWLYDFNFTHDSNTTGNNFILFKFIDTTITVNKVYPSGDDVTGTYSISPNTLKEDIGLDFAKDTGTISGAPTKVLQKTYTIRFTGNKDFIGKSKDIELTLTIEKKLFPRTKQRLISLIKVLMDRDNDGVIDNNVIDLNGINTSAITDMSGIFNDIELRRFNGNISDWDVSNVTNMSSMFENSSFNGDISNWDISNVTNMSSMFENSSFNGDISDWDISNVTNMSSMFKNATAFNKFLNIWKNKLHSSVNITDIFSGVPKKVIPFWLYNFQFILEGKKGNSFSLVKGKSSTIKILHITETGTYSISPNTLKEDTGLDFAEDTGTISGIPSKVLSEKEYIIRFTRAGDSSGESIDMPPLTLIISKGIVSYFPKTKAELITKIKEIMDTNDDNDPDDNTANLNVIYTGNITDMSNLFSANDLRSFNGNISEWDVSNVTNMSSMFKNSSFNGDISDWDVSNVINMSEMFRDNKIFNGDISEWKTEKVTNMNRMFDGGYSANDTERRDRATVFNQDISGWDVSKVTNMVGMFYNNKKFNQDLSGWDVSKVTDMDRMFTFTEAFNNDLSDWDTGNVTNMNGMFKGSSFVGYGDKDGDGNDESYISGWDVSKVTNMSGMFYRARNFNGDIAYWNIRAVRNMSRMFNEANAFNRKNIYEWGAKLPSSGVTKENVFDGTLLETNNQVPDWAGGSYTPTP